MKNAWLIFGMVFLMAGSAYAAEKPAQFIWEPVPNVNSANIARLDWELVGSNSLSWPDGRLALISYWKDRKQNVVMRCVDFKNKEFQDTGSLCSQPAVLKK